MQTVRLLRAGYRGIRLPAPRSQPARLPVSVDHAYSYRGTYLQPRASLSHTGAYMAHVARDDAERLLAVRLPPPLLPFAARHSHRRCSPPCLARTRAPDLIPHAQAV